MKKTNKILLVAVILAVFFTAMPIIAQDSNSESSPYPVSTFKLSRLRDDMYVQPDPDNPYQGTWANKGRKKNWIYTIKGTEAISFYDQGVFGWREMGTYRVDDTWILSDNNTTLDAPVNVMQRSLFERYIKE